MALTLIPDVVEDTEQPCKGVYYRYIQSTFTGKAGRIVFSNELRPLKSISCPGCSKCFPDIACLEELLSCIGEHAIEFSPQLKSGDTAVLLCVVDSRDRETGHVDDYHYVAHVANVPPKMTASAGANRST